MASCKKRNKGSCWSTDIGGSDFIGLLIKKAKLKVKINELQTNFGSTNAQKVQLTVAMRADDANE